MSKMRVWHMPQVGCNATIHIPVESELEGKKIMDILAAYDLFQLENNIKPDFCNINGLQVFNEDEQVWENWFLETEDDFYDVVDDYINSTKDKVKAYQFSKELFGQLKSNC